MRTRFALVVFVLVATSSALCQDARGWFEQYCDGAIFHLQKFDGQTSQQELTFWFRTSFKVELYTGTDWDDVQLCPSERTCDQAAKAKMKFLKREKNRVAGRYVVDVNGKHVEGQFVLKERHHKHPMHLCM